MFGLKELSFNFLTGHPLLTGLFLLLMILMSVYLYRRTNPPLPRAIRILLAALRIVAVLALFLALFEPVAAFRRDYESKPRLTILIDESRSMNIVEKGKSREERIDSLLSSPAFIQFADQFEIVKKPFAGGLIEKSASASLDETAIGDAMKELSEEELATKSEYWLMLSDGISNRGISPIDEAVRVKTPVFTVGMGDLVSGKDVTISGFDYNHLVFAGKPTEVKVKLSWSGMNNDNGRIEIKSGSKVLQSKEIKLAPGDLQEDVPLSFTPERPGQQTFQVIISPLEGELSTDNNMRSFSMTVLKSKLKVLLAADHIDWEYAFLNRFLLNAENVDLNSSVTGKGGGALGVPFPSRQEELNQYDFIILYDINIDQFASRAPLIKSFLADKGGGLLAILGENYLKARFPRWIDEYLPFASKQKGNILYVKFNGKPSENYLFHPAVRLSDSRQAIRDSWGNLPPFETLVPIDTVMPGGEVLVSSGFSSGRGTIPVAGYRNIGGGKVLALDAAPFWHWAFYGYGFGREAAEYNTLFGGIVNWLGMKEDSDPIQIGPDKPVYTRGEKVGFRATVYDLGYRPITGVSGNITLMNEDGKDSTIASLVEQGDGKYRADFDMVPPGRFKYVAVLEKDEKKLRETDGEIAVESYQIEDYQSRPDFGALTRISQMTGGAFYPLDKVDSLYSRLDHRPIQNSVQSELVIWNKFWLLAIFVLALGAEWLLRKRFELL
ncbi:membrane hypothetical protein [Candidatus Zixiibacteriota bacterium]|nr:membrane hypothetical protein [candidate division Zixibacteria bacterium]